VDSLEMVRQLFEVGVLQSDFGISLQWLRTVLLACIQKFGVVKETEAMELSLITILIILIQQESIMINSVWTQEIFIQFHARNLFWLRIAGLVWL
jgi:hypothetical protein